MDRTTMRMIAGPVAMVCLGVNMDEWNGEYPQRQPRQDDAA